MFNLLVGVCIDGLTPCCAGVGGEVGEDIESVAGGMAVEGGAGGDEDLGGAGLEDSVVFVLDWH